MEINAFIERNNLIQFTRMDLIRIQHASLMVFMEDYENGVQPKRWGEYTDEERMAITDRIREKYNELVEGLDTE